MMLFSLFDHRLIQVSVSRPTFFKLVLSKAHLTLKQPKISSTRKVTIPEFEIEDKVETNLNPL